tara:strand:+ start:2903 stop:3775 length:873 start_codon:yes stop_codon:yes gene_type:complete
MEADSKSTVEHTDQNVPVTDSATDVDNSLETVKSEKNTTPSVEVRDGKLFVDGNRVYSRDDVNKIGANARKEVESRLISDLNVDSIDSVKGVVRALQEAGSGDEGSSLNVESLRDAVKKREATVEELKQQVNSLRTDLLLKDHMGQLSSAMPGNWTEQQKSAVVKLMKADGMLAVEGDTFAIRNGNEYLTTDGETPDYKSAVELVGKNLGLNFGKLGVDMPLGENRTSSEGKQSIKPADQNKVKNDPAYREAYLDLRLNRKGGVSSSEITDNMIRSRASDIQKGKTKNYS